MKQARTKQLFTIWILLAWMGLVTASSNEIDLTPYWNAEIPLANPYKGWYHHYPDNHINKYIIKDDQDLLDIPGMDHLYLRLAWAYLEPQEGQFNWDIIDSIIEKWTGKGLKIAFRISCKETSTDRIEQQFATPKWVMDAGAQGGFYRSGQVVASDGPWEPRFDDPVYLDKLENFIQAFAERYDRQPWMRYVDIGSIGDWGEGHTHSGSRKIYDYAARKKHIDLHLRYFKKTQLVISDDFVYSIPDKAERQACHDYIVKNGISYRDDSILVDWFVQVSSDMDSVRSPEFFEDVYQTRPTVLELEHYSNVRRLGNWLGKEGSTLQKHGKGKTGARIFLGAIERLHATYIGYHGDAADWYRENPDLTVELLNRCGYWYFPHSAELPETVRPDQDSNLLLTWENKGMAPAYHDFQLKIRLEGPRTIEWTRDANNRAWLPSNGSQTVKETYPIHIPADSQPGNYDVKIKLVDPSSQETVFLPLDEKRKDKDDYYTLSRISITR